MNPLEMEALAALLRPPARARIAERAARGAEFREWAVTLKDPPQGSSLQLGFGDRGGGRRDYALQ
ncbi:hypothetical protein [Nocardia salmonicida]|uniref:hypothetical protein n=1 Tax=Nocardia salmonicida TaxID=53431 RepID=UPI0037964B14